MKLEGVAKTALVPLRARAEEHAREDRVFEDRLAVEWLARADWPPELDAWFGPDAQQNLALRAHDIDMLVRAFAASQVNLRVVELGGGFSTRRHRLRDLELSGWVDVDLPEVVALRETWGDDGQLVASSVLDPGWMDQVFEDPTLFVAEGLLYYLPREEAQALLTELGRRFPGAGFVMDVLGEDDFPQLLEDTTAVGSPIAWGYEGDLDEAPGAFGLRPIEGLEPAATSRAAIRRYWPRFSARLRAAIYMATSQPELWARRSGNVIGLLG